MLSYNNFISRLNEWKLNTNLPDYIEIDGKKRSTINSIGEYIHSNEENIINFWKWFGDSKIIDNQGKPLVVVHKSNQLFNIFDKSKQQKNDWGSMGTGFYFYPLTTFNAFGKYEYQVYLKINNPKIVSLSEYNKNNGIRTKENSAIFTQNAIEKGHDGMILYGKQEYSVFEPNQIKSVKNIGYFDPENPNINENFIL